MGIPLETYSNTFVHIVKGLNSLNYTRIGAYIYYFILIDIAITVAPSRTLQLVG
jgi:hypothetical protein